MRRITILSGAITLLLAGAASAQVTFSSPVFTSPTVSQPVFSAPTSRQVFYTLPTSPIPQASVTRFSQPFWTPNTNTGTTFSNPVFSNPTFQGTHSATRSAAPRPAAIATPSSQNARRALSVFTSTLPTL